MTFTFEYYVAYVPMKTYVLKNTLAGAIRYFESQKPTLPLTKTTKHKIFHADKTPHPTRIYSLLFLHQGGGKQSFAPI